MFQQQRIRVLVFLYRPVQIKFVTRQLAAPQDLFTPKRPLAAAGEGKLTGWDRTAPWDYALVNSSHAFKGKI